MAHSKSRQKRVRQNHRRRALNRWRKRRIKLAMRAYREAILHGSVEDAQERLRELFKLVDQIAAKGAIHPNKASRHKSRLSRRLEHKKKAA